MPADDSFPYLGNALAMLRDLEANATAATEAAEKVIEALDIGKNAEVHISNNPPYIGTKFHNERVPSAIEMKLSEKM